VGAAWLNKPDPPGDGTRSPPLRQRHHGDLQHVFLEAPVDGVSRLLLHLESAQ